MSIYMNEQEAREAFFELILEDKECQYRLRGKTPEEKRSFYNFQFDIRKEKQGTQGFKIKGTDIYYFFREG